MASTQSLTPLHGVGLDVWMQNRRWQALQLARGTRDVGLPWVKVI
jgi:hypothetical protein